MVQTRLTARVTWSDGQYIARVDRLPLEAAGASVKEAQDELILLVRAWIQTNDGMDRLGPELALAGYVGVDEDTELELEFLE